MGKRAFMATVIITAFLVSTVAGMYVVKLTIANFVPNFPPPNKDPPILALNAPQNFTAVNVNSILINFTVSKPGSWNQSSANLPSVGTIDGINVTLNGKNVFQDNGFSMYGLWGNWSQVYLVKIDGLHEGANTLKVNVQAGTSYLSAYWDESGKELVGQFQYPMTVTDTIILNYTDETANANLSLEITAIVVIVAVVVGLLVYFSKRRGKKQ